MRGKRGSPVQAGMKLLSVILLISMAIPFVSAASGPLPDHNDLYIETVNTPRFDDFGNGTYWFWFPEDAGLNTLHITDDYMDAYGQVTTTAEMAGSFYVTDTGGMTYKDDVILMLAVNGSVDENFSLNLRCNGYQWTPNACPHMPPSERNVTYVKDCLSATFTKDDFLKYDGKNIKQTWKIFNTADYPLYYGQDVSDTDNAFKLMFVDLNAGVINADKLGYTSLKNGGAVKVNYAFENLGDSYAALNVYAYSKRPEYDDRSLDNTTQWTNRLTDDAGRTVSGYSVWSLFAPQVTSVSVTPKDPVISPDTTLQLTAVGLDQAGDEIPNLTFVWENDNPGAGWIDQSGLFTTTGIGVSNITATYGNITGTSQVVVAPDQSPIYVAADGSGNYTTITEAILYAHEGTEIVVCDGTYRESVNVPRTLTIQSENGPDTTVLNLSTLPEQTAGFTLNADGVIISGFTVTGCTGDGSSEGFAVTFNEASDSILCDCIITGNTDGVFLNSGDNNTVVGNVVDCPEAADHYGFRIKKNSAENRIYQNSFASGLLKVAAGSTGNLWNTLAIYPYSYDDGSAVQHASSQTGNYWSGYTGDEGAIPGIGNDSYAVPGADGTDLYPLVSPIGSYAFGTPIPAGDTFYVGPGEDFTTIQSAVYAANTGYTIIVRDGTYTESVTIDKSVRLFSENGADAVTLQAMGYRGIYVTADDVWVDGLTITNTTGDSDAGGIYLMDASDCLIINNIVGGDGVGIVMNGNASQNMFINNTVSLNTDKKRMISIKSPDCEENYVITNIFARGKAPKDDGTDTHFNTTWVIEDYIYDGYQSSSPFGNYWVAANKTDANHNGISDVPYVDGATDYFPLVSDDLSMYHMNGDYKGNVTKDVPLDVPECTFSGLPGAQSVVVDNATGSATVYADRIVIEENGFVFVINTVGSPGGNTTVITGDVASVEILITPIATQFDGAGAVQAFVEVDLTALPAGAELDSILNGTVSADDLAAFEAMAKANGLTVGDIACALRAVKSAGFDDYVTGAEVVMTIDAAWVDAHGGPSKIRILRQADDGTGQVLETTYAGPTDGKYTFIGVSPDGLSLFGLASVSAIPSPGGGGGGSSHSVGVAAERDIEAGQAVTFSMTNTAVYAISLVTTEDVREMMLTATKGATPDGAEAPDGDVYQYIGVQEYKADPGVIEMATLRFTVDSAVFTGDSSEFSGVYDPALTELMYYDEDEGAWQTLSTVQNGETDRAYEYFADTARLGSFAIVLHRPASGTEQPAGTDDTNTPSAPATPAVPDTPDMTGDVPDTVPPTTTGLLLSGLFSVIGAIGIAGLVSRARCTRKDE